MAFSFGNPPAPAGGAGGAFSFGGSAPAPAPSSGGLFGSSSAAPAPGAFSFGSSSPAPSTFGLASPPPSTYGTPAPAQWGGGGLFGSAPAPAQGGNLFGSAPATSSMFGSPSAPTPQAPPVSLSPQTPYSLLPPEAQRAIDTIHEHMMRHKRTMLNVETMAPALLRDPATPADAAAGDTNTLKKQLAQLQHHLQGMQYQLDRCRTQAQALTRQFETAATQSIMYGLWPVEALAIRRGVKLSSTETATDPDVKAKLQIALDQQVAHVDRLEKIPSPYMWHVLEDLETRLSVVRQNVLSLKNDLDRSKDAADDIDVVSIVQAQAEAFARVAYSVAKVHEQMEALRSKYRGIERGEDIFRKAQVEEAERQQRVQQQAKTYYLKAGSHTNAPTQTAAAPAGGPGSAPAPAPGSLFGSTPAPAPGSLFGSAPAPASTGSGGLFGNTPAPAPGGGGLFGGAPAAAPAGGSLFGATPAPAPAAGNLFGATPAPAPAGGSLFGATPAPGAPPAPAPGGLFGSTPSAGTGLFGSAAPSTPGALGSTPAPSSFSFGANTSSSNITATPKSKSKPRGRGRR